MSDPLLLLGVSGSPRTLGPGGWDRLLAVCESEVADLSDPGTSVSRFDGTTCAVIGAGPLAQPHRGSSPRAPRLVGTAHRLVSRDGSHTDPSQLARDATFDQQLDRLAGIVPPFGYIGAHPEQDLVVAGTDAIGLEHVYVAQAGGVAFVSTSATLLARLTEADLDDVAWSVYALIGCLLGSRTMFRGVRKLDPAERVWLAGGEITSRVNAERIPLAARADGHYTSEAEALDAGEAALGGALRSLSQAFPEAQYELSGGLDSRLVLALALQHSPCPLRTLSIGGSESADLRVAHELALRHSLHEQVVPLSFVEHASPEVVAAGVLRAARQRDFAANPLSGFLYDEVGARAPATAQVTGQAGELARGKYYAGQRERQRYSRSQASRLIQWREVVNQQVTGTLFSPDFWAASHNRLMEASWPYFAACPAAWPAVTDHWYVFGRNQRLAGAVYSQWGSDRQVIAPFFHPDFIEWAGRLPVSLKRNSRAFVGLIQRLQPELAEHPLASGLTPSQAARRARGSRLVLLRRDAARARRKLRQRISGRREVSVQTDEVAVRAQQGLSSQLPAALSSIDWLDHTALDRVHAGDFSLDPVSMAFLTNLAGAAGVRAGSTRPTGPLPTR